MFLITFNFYNSILVKLWTILCCSNFTLIEAQTFRAEWLRKYSSILVSSPSQALYLDYSSCGHTLVMEICDISTYNNGMRNMNRDQISFKYFPSSRDPAPELLRGWLDVRLVPHSTFSVKSSSAFPRIVSPRLLSCLSGPGCPGCRASNKLECFCWRLIFVTGTSLVACLNCLNCL